jgi:hypothetical protein
MGLDIRLPIGLLFLALGGVLTYEGVVSGSEIYVRSAGVNVNLYWGLVLLVFGLIMAIFGQKGTAELRRAMATGEGRAMADHEGFHGHGH